MSYNIVQDYTEHKYIEHKFTLDCKKSQSQVSIPVRENDTAIKLFITLQDGREPFYIEDGCISAIFIKKSDGTICENACIIEDNRTIRYDFTEGTANVEGINDCEVRVYSADGTMLTSPRFIMVVTNRVLSDDKITKDERTIMDKILLSELGRVTAENSREEEETARRENEAKRVQAEGDREDIFSKKIDEINGKLAKGNLLVFDTKEHLNQFIGGYESTKNLCPLPRIDSTDYYTLTHNDNGTFNFDVSHDIGEPVPFGSITLEPGVYVFTRYNCEFFIGITIWEMIPISKPFEVTETTEYDLFSSGYAGDSFKNAWVQITKGESVPDEFIPYYAPYTREDGKTVNDLSPGDILLITEEGVSDYWWDGNAIRPIEAQADQTFNPGSDNAQSGKAVAEAVATEQKRSDNTFANALKGNKSDTAILLDDISPVTHEMEVKVRGKNLFDKSIPYGDYTPHGGGYSLLSIYVGSGSSVTVSLKQKHDIGLGGYFFCIAYKSSEVAEGSRKWLYYNTNTAICEKSVTMISEDGYVSLFMTPDAYNNFKDEIMVEIGTTATDYTPYVPDLTAVKVSRYGKNLFDIDTVLPSFINNYGDVGKWIKQSDGSYYKLNVGTGDGDIWFENKANYKGQIAISVASKHTITEVGGVGLTLEVAYTDGTKKTAIHTPMLSETYSVKTFVTDANKTVFRITQSYHEGQSMYVKDVMIAYGSDTTYEPFISPTTYQSTADGIVEGVLSLYPNTTLMTDTEGVLIDCEYNRDINKAFAALEAAIATNNS